MSAIIRIFINSNHVDFVLYNCKKVTKVTI